VWLVYYGTGLLWHLSNGGRRSIDPTGSKEMFRQHVLFMKDLLAGTEVWPFLVAFLACASKLHSLGLVPKVIRDIRVSAHEVLCV
jgi:hypothetical protein